LIARHAIGFDTLITALLSLDTSHHGLLRTILERCSDLTDAHAEEHGGIVKALNGVESIEDDVRGVRNERRKQRGYVALADARAFLRLAALKLEYDGARDPITHAHFRDRSAKRVHSKPPRPEAPSRPSRRLIETLGPELVTPSPLPKEGRLNRALEELRGQTDTAYAERMDELAYLANVLIAASTAHARRLRPIEATAAVLYVCDAGIARLGFSAESAAELALRLATLQLDVVFRAGFADVLADEADAGPISEWLRVL
jgi:hypothetical protein